MQEFKLIGSHWMQSLFPEMPETRVKDTSDVDILVREPYSKQDVQEFRGRFGKRTELHYIPDLWRALENKKLDPRDIAFTLKASHVSFDSVHKAKTFYDLFWMSRAGCKIIEQLFHELHDFWCNKFTEPWRADFIAESEEFFDDAVSREHVHDDLHKRVAYYDQPAFKFLQEPGQTTVWVCPIKFYQTTEHIRQRVVIEEAQTLALERHILPGASKRTVKALPPRLAYMRMIEALVDRLAPLWMAIYIIENLHYFLTFKEEFAHEPVIV